MNEILYHSQIKFSSCVRKITGMIELYCNQLGLPSHSDKFACQGSWYGQN